MKKMGRLQSMSLKHKILAVILTGFLVLFLAGIVSLEFVSNSYEKKLYNSIAASLTDSALEISDQLKYIDTIVDLDIIPVRSLDLCLIYNIINLICTICNSIFCKIGRAHV